MKAYEESVRNKTWKGDRPLPQLSKMLGENLKPDQLPQILFYHGHLKKTFTYPKKLGDDHVYDNSEELIELWALKSMFEGDVPMMDEFITTYMN